ncbi:MAG TPA: LysM domain-containing protein [Clostridia bacterium]|nr:LysM domain-containing protein [Clostridia bacterium]
MKYLPLLLVLVTIHYTVATGDTLQLIAERYCPGTDPRQVAEFREGIRELNYDALGDAEVWPGLVLSINRWEEDGE